MKHQWRRLAAGLLFLGLAFLALWGSQVTWASSSQSPAQQTVPTRGPTATATRVNTAVPQPTAVPPTSTPVPKTSTPVPPGATAVPATSAPIPTQPPDVPAASVSSGVLATANENLRIRSGPSTGAAVAGQLKKGETAQAVGRSAASDWLQIVLPGNANARGWISAGFASTSAPVSELPVVAASPSVQAPVPTSPALPVVLADTPAPVLPTIGLPPATPLPSVTPRPTVTTAADTDQPPSSNPWLTVVIGLVMLGLGGGFILVLFGGLLTIFGRR